MTPLGAFFVGVWFGSVLAFGLAEYVRRKTTRDGRRSASGVPLCDHGQAEGTCAMTGCWATRDGRTDS